MVHEIPPWLFLEYVSSGTMPLTLGVMEQCMSDQHEAEYVTGAGCWVILAVASKLHKRFVLPVYFDVVA